MIGLQDLVLKRKIKTKDLAQQIGVTLGTICDWFNKNKVPKKHLRILANIFNVEEDYINTQVNDIVTYKPRKRGFNNYKIIGDIAEIYAVKKSGEIIPILVDAEDITKLVELDYSWSAILDPNCDIVYAQTTQYYEDENGKRKQTRIAMHEVIGGSKLIDHIDHNGLNNRKYNLRKSTKIQNATNRKGKNKNNKSGYRNVMLDKKSGRYIIMLCVNNKRFRVGKYYTDVDEAGKDAEIYRKQYYGDFAGEG